MGIMNDPIDLFLLTFLANLIALIAIIKNLFIFVFIYYIWITMSTTWL